MSWALASAAPAGAATAKAPKNPTVHKRADTLAPPALRRLDATPLALGVLNDPSPIAVGAGHVVVVGQPTDVDPDWSLIDLQPGVDPRVLLRSTRPFGRPVIGTDAQSRPVVVASPCAGSALAVLGQAQGTCPLRSVDLATGTSVAIPGTSGASEGDLDGSRVLFARPAGRPGVRLYLETLGSTATSLPLPSLSARLSDPSSGAPALVAPRGGAGVTVGGLDLNGDNEAVVLEWPGTTTTSFESALFTHADDGDWQYVTAIGTGASAATQRHVLGPRLGAHSVDAYVEGAIDLRSFVGEWSLSGQLTDRATVRPQIGNTTIAYDAGFDGDALTLLSWTPTAACSGDLMIAPCALTTVSPLGLD